MSHRLQAGWKLAVLAIILCCHGGFAQARAKRLILKDGSYQPIVRWEVKGDRVRYYSAERFEWEELPTTLVDWAATDKYNKDLEEGVAEQGKRMAAEDEAEWKAADAKSPAVAPGLKLPDTGGVYLLDVFHGKPELDEVVQSGGELHKNMGRNILRAAINPIASAKQSIEIKGARARIQAHVNDPTLYIDISENDASAGPYAENAGRAPDTSAPPLDQRYRIVRLQKKKDTRVVGNLKIAFYGKVSQQENWVPTKVEPVTSEWVKITPATPLAAGEYALVEMLAGKQMNLYVWDFGVNPSAPQNPLTWTPVQPKSTQTGTNESPVLETRPRK